MARRKRSPNHRSASSRKTKPGGVDFISSIPDVILQHILSYIPTKFTIRTSVLSKRWRRVWQETPSISIQWNREDNPYSIDKTLRSYSSLKITSFHVDIKYPINTKLVDRWIKLATSLNAENLTLKLEPYGRIPDSFYVNPSVKQISLTMGQHSRAKFDFEFTVSWTSLKNLSLKYCTMSNESIANILFGCPMLETLILNQCLGIQRLDLSRSVNLKRLVIIGGNWVREPDEIVAPHIHYLSLTNFHKPPTLVDISSLTEANLGYIDYGIVKRDFLQDMVLKLLAKLQNVEKLTICATGLQILSLAELQGVPFPQFKIIALTVETMLVRSVIPGIIGLLQNSPRLKKMTLYTTDQCNAIWEGNFNRYLHNQGLNKDRGWSEFFSAGGEAEHVALLDSFAKDDKSEHVALFIKLVSLKAKTLETMVLRLGGYLNATEYKQLLRKVSRKNNNLRKDGQGKAIFNTFKIIP